LNASSSDSDRYLLRLRGMKRPVTTLVILATAFVCLLILVLAGAFISLSRTAQRGDAEVANTNIARMIAVQMESTLKTASVALTDLSERLEVDGTGAHELGRLQAHLGPAPNYTDYLPKYATSRPASFHWCLSPKF